MSVLKPTSNNKKFIRGEFYFLTVMFLTAYCLLQLILIDFKVYSMN